MARTVRNYTCPVCEKDCSKVLKSRSTAIWETPQKGPKVQTVRTKPYKGVATITYIHTACYEQLKRGKKGGESDDQ